MTTIKEKLLKDSFTRTNDLSMDVTSVKVDTRHDSHDILNVSIRGTPAGQIVTDKSDSITIARRLIPDSLRYDKEPSTITKDAETLASAYFELLVEARTAVSTRDVSSLAAFLRKHDANGNVMPGDSYVFLPDRVSRLQDESTERPKEPPAGHTHIGA